MEKKRKIEERVKKPKVVYRGVKLVPACRNTHAHGGNKKKVIGEEFIIESCSFIQAYYAGGVVLSGSGVGNGCGCDEAGGNGDSAGDECPRSGESDIHLDLASAYMYII